MMESIRADMNLISLVSLYQRAKYERLTVNMLLSLNYSRTYDHIENCIDQRSYPETDIFLFKKNYIF